MYNIIQHPATRIIPFNRKEMIFCMYFNTFSRCYSQPETTFCIIIVVVCRHVNCQICDIIRLTFWGLLTQKKLLYVHVSFFRPVAAFYITMIFVQHCTDKHITLFKPEFISYSIQDVHSSKVRLLKGEFREGNPYILVKLKGT